MHNKATLRKIIRETTRIAEEAYGDVDDIDEFIDDTEKTILKVTQERSAGEFRDIRGVIRSVTDRLNLLQKIDGNNSIDNIFKQIATRINHRLNEREEEMER